MPATKTKTHFIKNDPHILMYVLSLLSFIGVLKYYIATRYKHLIPYLLQHFVIMFFAFALTAALIPLCMKAGRAFHIVDKHHKAKTSPVPLLGGLGIYLSFLIMAFFDQPWTPQITAIVDASTIIMVLGTIDDIQPLSSTIRLIGQLVASGLVISVGLRVSFMPHTWWGDLGADAITLIWILGIINATNFVDGMDGLAAGFSFTASLFFFLITLHLHQWGVTLLASIIIGCSLGFLVYNFKPAKIYLGDGGSTFLGFMLACMGLYGGWSNWDALIGCSIPILILSVLIFDMIYITISRIKNGQVRNFKEWLDYRGQDHFHHRLIHLGFKVEEAVIFICLTSMILGLSALVIEHARVSYPVVILLVQAVMIFVNITILMLIGRKTIVDAHEK